MPTVNLEEPSTDSEAGTSARLHTGSLRALFALGYSVGNVVITLLELLRMVFMILKHSVSALLLVTSKLFYLLIANKLLGFLTTFTVVLAVILSRSNGWRNNETDSELNYVAFEADEGQTSNLDSTLKSRLLKFPSKQKSTHRGPGSFESRLIDLENSMAQLHTRIDGLVRVRKHARNHWHRWWSGDQFTGDSSNTLDLQSLISTIVDHAVCQSEELWPDFALSSAGANTIPSFTSTTYGICQTRFEKLLGFLTGSHCAHGRNPAIALNHVTQNGHCWPLAGDEGHLGIVLAAPIYISNITIDHVHIRAAWDTRSAPKDMELWGMVEGMENIAKVARWRDAKSVEGPAAEAYAAPSWLSSTQGSKFLRIAKFSYDAQSNRNVQTFSINDEITRLAVDFGIVILRIKNNWGRKEFTCLYRVRVHGQTMHH